jgi:hypothetical protein
VLAVVVGEVAHQPHAGMRHLDDGGDALGGGQPQERHGGWRGYRVTIERDDAKHMAG